MNEFIRKEENENLKPLPRGMVRVYKVYKLI